MQTANTVENAEGTTRAYYFFVTEPNDLLKRRMRVDVKDATTHEAFLEKFKDFFDNSDYEYVDGSTRLVLSTESYVPDPPKKAKVLHPQHTATVERLLHRSKIDARAGMGYNKRW
jgi:hypothetical protein